MSNLILGIDAGNYRTKVAGEYGVLSYSSAICDWFQRDIVESFGDDDMEFSIGERKGFAGSIAEYEDIYGGEAMYGDSKAHDDTKVKVLLGIYRYMKKYGISNQNLSIIVGQPISQHVQKDKEFIQKMLQGYQEFTVNGEHQAVWIDKIGVVAEGSGAFWSDPSDGIVRIVDVGSGTVNLATIINKNHVNTGSETLNFGMETGRNKRDLDSMVRGIIRGTTRLQWQREDNVLVCGGIARDVTELIISHFPNAKVIQPILKGNGRVSVVESTYANAVGFYQIAKGVFG